MIVREIMNADVATCMPANDLEEIVETMRDRRCGFLPVVDSHSAVVGVVTDRDVCLAGAKHRPLSRISAKETMSTPVFSCFPDEDVRAVLQTMAKQHIRRVPVLDRDGHLHGVLSIDDIAQAPRRPDGPTAEAVVGTLKEISAYGSLRAW